MLGYFIVVAIVAGVTNGSRLTSPRKSIVLGVFWPFTLLWGMYYIIKLMVEKVKYESN